MQRGRTVSLFLFFSKTTSASVIFFISSTLLFFPLPAFPPPLCFPPLSNDVMDLSNNDIFKPPNNKNKAGRTGEGEGFEGETSRHRRLSLAHCLEGGNGQHGATNVPGQHPNYKPLARDDHTWLVCVCVCAGVQHFKHEP